MIKPSGRGASVVDKVSFLVIYATLFLFAGHVVAGFAGVVLARGGF